MEIIITLIVIAGLFLFIRKYEQEHSAVKTLRREGYVVKKHAGAYFIWLNGEAEAVMTGKQLVATANLINL